MPTSTKEKVILITGANGGLGRTVTKAFPDAGAIVVGISETISDTDFPDPRFSSIATTISSGQDARSIAHVVVAKHGRLDGLVHLIGGFTGGKTVADTDDESFGKMVDVNFRFAFYLIRATLTQMKEQRAGRIVAIGSKAALEPSPMARAYAASKAALMSLIKTVASENSDDGITANVVLPGTIDTPANRRAMPDADFNAWISTDQVAGLLIYLVLGDSSQINGAAVPIYGAEA
jgi:NAD(P)-dependent dehydrogenase (short-subunit alcohol dehydrogenase family)